MADEEQSNEDEGCHGPRLIQPEFRKSRYRRIEAPMHPPVYNGDEGTQSVQSVFLEYSIALEETIVVTDEKKRVLLTDGLKKLDYQWSTLENKESELRAMVKKYNRFIRENLMKRERFVDSYRRSMEFAKKYILECDKMKGKIAFLEQTSKQMRNEIEKHALYEKFLQSTVRASGEFKTVHSFVEHFKVLIDTLHDTTEVFVKNKSLLLFLLHHLNDGLQKEVFVVNELMNRLCKLGPHLNEAKLRNLENERIISDVRGEALKCTSDVHRTLDFMNQLYQLVCSRGPRTAKYVKGDYRNQMMTVRRALKNFKTVLKRCHETTEELE